MKVDEQDPLYDEKFKEPSPEDFLHDDESLAKENPTKNRRSFYIKLIGVAVAVALIFQGANSFVQLFSKDSIELVRTSEQYNDDKKIAALKKAVVTIQGQGSKGTGFLISQDGYILTNHHVIDHTSPIAVILSSGDIYEGQVIQSDPNLDIALLQVEGKDLPYLPIRTYSADRNESIYVIGNPLSHTLIVNQGEVINEEKPFQKMKISAPIYPGHSGSPVLSENGEVVGVVYARTIPSLKSDEEGHGLAVPIDRIIDEFSIVHDVIRD